VVLGFGQRPGEVVEDDDVAGVGLVQHQVVVGGGLVLVAFEQSLGQAMRVPASVGFFSTQAASRFSPSSARPNPSKA
jgi:hypothetical protein